MKPYPKYKDSGIEWIGEMPEHWDAKKIKYICSIDSRKLAEDTRGDYEFQYIDIGNVSADGSITVSEPMTFKNAPSRARRIVEKDDVIVSTVRTYLRAIAYIESEAKDLIVSTGFAVLSANEMILPKYLYYLVASQYVVETVSSLSVGVSYPAVNASDLGNISIFIPSIPEQQAIASFLDDKTKQIDLLIEKKQKQIELLQEERTAIISEAVTKGLNPNAKMKDSGIEWIGKIPEHWKLKKIRYLADSVETGRTPPSDESKYYEEGTLDWFSPSDFGQEIELVDSQRKLNTVAVDDGVARLYGKGTVLLVGIGATLGKVGILKKQGSSNQQINAIRFKDIVNPYFYAYYLASISKSVVSLSNASTLAILNQSQTKDIVAIEPPKNEQDAIVNHIGLVEDAKNQLRSRIEKQIFLLQEYRQSLISEVVTGKIDVREVA